MNPDIPSPDRIIKMASAFYDSCTLFAASDLGIFNALGDMGEAGAETIAEKLQLNPRGTRLLMDACTALGLLEKHDDQYRNSPESSTFLVSGMPGDLSGAIRYNRDVYAAWGRLCDLVRSGAPAESPASHLGDDPDRTRTFVLSMHYRALGIGRAVVPMMSLENRTRLLDVGGGPGTYACLLAGANPELKCTVLDLPAVTAIASELIAEQGLADRVSTLPGDYHTTPFPAPLDVVNFLGVLHQESEDSIRALFARAFDALEPGGLIHVMDMMTDASHTQPVFSALFAVNMALTTDNGWVFSDYEVTTWLEGAGFEQVQIRALPEPMPHWLATAQKPLS